MRPDLSDLEAMARAAGEILREGFGNVHQVERKGVINPVTEVDRQSERYLLGEIDSRFPGQRVVSEESGGLPGSGERVWYVDPLDGTVNFAHGLPIFSLSLAYAEGGEMKFGVVYDPIQDECYTAERGGGAWLNGRPIAAGGREKLAESLLVTGFPYDSWSNPDNNLDHFGRFLVRCQGIRRLGSAALDLCYVADGRLDGFWEIRLSSWDVAAGGLIAAEAGARVTNLHGGADYLSPPQSIVAANPKLHPQMLAVLQGEG